MNAPQPGARRRLTLTGALLAVALGLACWAVSPPAPAEAQTSDRILLWSGTLNAGAENLTGGLEITGCSNALIRKCVDRLTNYRFPYGGSSLVKAIYVYTAGSSQGRLEFEYGGGTFPAALRNSGILVVDNREIALSSMSQWPSGGLYLDNSGLAWTAGQNISLKLYIPRNDRNVQNEYLEDPPYDWCFNIAPFEVCVEHIARWQTEAEYVSTVNNVCPRTHSIRESYKDSVRCKQSFYPVLYTGQYPKAGFTPPPLPPPPDPCGGRGTEVHTAYRYGQAEYAQPRTETFWFKDTSSYYGDGDGDDNNGTLDAGALDPWDTIDKANDRTGQAGWVKITREAPADGYRTYTACLPPG